MMNSDPRDTPLPRPAIRHRIPWARPEIGPEEADAASELILRGELTMGETVRNFEAAVAAAVGRRSAAAVTTGTAALQLAVHLAGINPGDEVLVSALSYIATLRCLLEIGAKPVLCDVSADNLNVNPSELELRITPKTKAILLSEFCGIPLRWDAVEKVAVDHGLLLLVDGAQSMGTSFDGKAGLARGSLSTTSFHSAKVITTGQGGMVFFDDAETQGLVERLRDQGRTPGALNTYLMYGSNLKMTDFQAAIGLAQLEKLGSNRAARARAAATYARALAGLSGLELLKAPAGSEPCWFSFPVLVERRDEVGARLEQEGVEAKRAFQGPVHFEDSGGQGSETDFPVASAQAQRSLSLPMFPSLPDDDIETVCSIIADVLT